MSWSSSKLEWWAFGPKSSSPHAIDLDTTRKSLFSRILNGINVKMRYEICKYRDQSPTIGKRHWLPLPSGGNKRSLNIIDVRELDSSYAHQHERTNEGRIRPIRPRAGGAKADQCLTPRIARHSPEKSDMRSTRGPTWYWGYSEQWTHLSAVAHTNLPLLEDLYNTETDSPLSLGISQHDHSWRRIEDFPNIQNPWQTGQEENRGAKNCSWRVIWSSLPSKSPVLISPSWFWAMNSQGNSPPLTLTIIPEPLTLSSTSGISWTRWLSIPAVKLSCAWLSHLFLRVWLLTSSTPCYHILSTASRRLQKCSLLNMLLDWVFTCTQEYKILDLRKGCARCSILPL